MAGDLIFCRENDVDAGAVSASNSVASLPASNVKDFDIQRVWRAASNSASLFVDTGRLLTLGVVAGINSNATLGDTFRVRASTTDAGVASNLSYDSGSLQGVDPVWGQFIHFPFPPVPYRYLRLDMTQQDPPEIGRLMAGEAWRSTRHMSLVTTPESLWRDPSRWSYSIGQNLFVDSLAPQRGYRFTVRGVSDDEKISQIDEMNRLRGRRKDLLVCIDAASSNLGRDSIWGMLEQTITARRIADIQGYWECDVEIYARL
jgi:hypothetical protein